MPWDLKWADNKDLEFSSSQDIGLTVGEDLIQQRILLRLIMMRGWIYDTTGELGSNLWSTMRESTNEAAQDIPAMVLDALSPMEREITVTNIIVGAPPNVHTEAALMVVVEYTRAGNLAVQRINFPLI